MESVNGADLVSTLQTDAGPTLSHGDVNLKDYYKDIIQTAIDRQGWYGGMRISVPWLRMTLAGLESKGFAPELMWEGVEDPGTDRPKAAGVPSYDAIFEAERALVHKLNLR